MNMPKSHRRTMPRHLPRAQRGAVLYVALIMLILMALLGIAGMQVAGMQEKMASNYRAAARAFQNTEGVVRAAEHAVEGIANRTGDGGDLLGAGDISRVCDDGYDPMEWATERRGDADPAVNVRQIDSCVVGESPQDMGAPRDDTAPIYQITGFATDDADVNSSSVVIDTVFKL